MRILKKYSFLPLLMAVAVLGLAACDTAGDQEELQWEPGDQLEVDQRNADADLFGFDGFAPGITFFNVYAHNRNWDYDWTVSPDVMSSEVLQNQEFFRLNYDQPGDYVVDVSTTIDGQEYNTGGVPLTIEAPTLGEQIARLPQFSAEEADLFSLPRQFGTLNGVLAGEAADSLVGQGPFTFLAPSEAALTAAFPDGDDEDSDLDLPGANVLDDILQYHILLGDLDLDDINAGDSFETLEGSDVTFDGTASVDGNDVSETGLPISNGSLFTVDGLLLPPTASVDFNDQTTTDGVTVTVRSVYVPQDGYVAIHDSTLLDDPAQVPGSVIGVSEYLDAGVYNDLEVTLYDVPGKDFEEGMVLDGDQQLIAMPHQETNGNEEYNFITSDGSEDGAYVKDGEAVVDPAMVTVDIADDGEEGS